MKSCRKYSVLLAVVAVVVMSSADAEAQRIRTFGDAGDGATSGAAVSTQTPTTSAAAGATGESAEAPMGSYQIRIHGQNARQNGAERERIASMDATELYRGVIPGKRDEVDHISASRNGERYNPLTWVGFQAEPDRTRVFFQAPQALQYRVGEDRETGDLLVTFSNARITERNFSRFIDASFFNRSVQRIEAREVRRGTVEVRITRRDGATPNVTVDGQYLYLDFAHQSN